MELVHHVLELAEIIATMKTLILRYLDEFAEGKFLVFAWDQ